MTTTATARPSAPVLRTVTTEDLLAALRQGFADFTRAPLYGLFFGAVFTLIGVAISYMLVVHASTYWVLPVVAGFPLVGPFAALGLYEVSRRLERGRSLTWPGVLGVVLRESREVPSYAFVVLFVYLVWVYLAHLIFSLSFGLRPLTNVMTSTEVFLTTEGITMLVAGTLVGGAIALLLFAISVISVPMLIDRDVDIVTAMVTSVRSVLENRGTMLLWAAIVAVSIAVAMVPLFLGMLVVFPVLGHASWHLYRRAVAPAD